MSNFQRLLVGMAAAVGVIYSACGLRGEETVFIDDTAVNLPPAQALGIKTIRFENAAQCERELRALGCFEPSQ